MNSNAIKDACAIQGSRRVEVFEAVKYLDLSASCKSVLNNLVTRYNPKDSTRIYPSVCTIAIETGFSERHVRRILAALVSKGYIHKITQTKTSLRGFVSQDSNRYYLDPRIFADSKPEKFLAKREHKGADTLSMGSGQGDKGVLTPCPPNSLRESLNENLIKIPLLPGQKKKEELRKTSLKIVDEIPDEWKSLFDLASNFPRLRPSIKEKQNFVGEALERGISREEITRRVEIFEKSPYHRNTTRYLNWLFFFDVACSNERKERGRFLECVRRYQDPYLLSNFQCSREEFFSWLGVEDDSKETNLETPIEAIQDLIPTQDTTEIDKNPPPCASIEQELGWSPQNTKVDTIDHSDNLTPEALAPVAILPIAKRNNHNPQALALRNKLFLQLYKHPEIPEESRKQMLSEFSKIDDTERLQNISENLHRYAKSAQPWRS